jgi:hypothetical protein
MGSDLHFLKMTFEETTRCPPNTRVAGKSFSEPAKSRAEQSFLLPSIFVFLPRVYASTGNNPTVRSNLHYKDNFHKLILGVDKKRYL